MSASQRRRYAMRGLDRNLDGFDPKKWDFGVLCCWYCGEPAHTADHTTPVAMLKNIGLMPLLERPQPEIVPACQSCNSTLGDRYFPTMRERVEYLKSRLARRGARYLREPEWAPDDPAWDGLGGSLRSAVKRRQAQRAKYARRCAWGVPTLYELRYIALWAHEGAQVPVLDALEGAWRHLYPDGPAEPLYET